MANRAVHKLNVANSNYICAGDILRVTKTGEALRVTAARNGTARSWHMVKRPLWVLAWSRIRYRKRLDRFYRVIDDWYTPNMIRVVRDRPSPLPHRLP
jgi:hypothetical protein